MKSKALLIAYQDDLGARTLSTFFHSQGYRVDATRGMSEMIRRIRKGNVHVILIDDEIEGIKACEIVPLLKKIDPRIQIIVISSEESIGLVKRLRGAGIFYQAMKPVDLGEVKSAVECAFEKVEREHPKQGFLFFTMPELVPA
jgi:DNA-binding NtrC family response regulator